MNLETLVTKYIVSTEKAMKEIELKGVVSVTEENVANILGYVENYLEDAKYYKTQGKLETSLTSIAYCEGLLDALRLLGAVKFEWPMKTERKR
jgi:FAD synthetase